MHVQGHGRWQSPRHGTRICRMDRENRSGSMAESPETFCLVGTLGILACGQTFKQGVSRCAGLGVQAQGCDVR
jgi:hypothetical protein